MQVTMRRCAGRMDGCRSRGRKQYDEEVLAWASPTKLGAYELADNHSRANYRGASDTDASSAARAG
jgi:hypothetical protein